MSSTSSSSSSSDEDSNSLDQLFQETDDHAGLFRNYIEDTLEVPFWFLKETSSSAYAADLIEVPKIPSSLGDFAVQDFVDVRSPIVLATSRSDENEYEVSSRCFTLLFDLSASLFFTEFQDNPLKQIKTAAISQLEKLARSTGFIIPDRDSTETGYSTVFAMLALCFSSTRSSLVAQLCQTIPGQAFFNSWPSFSSFPTPVTVEKWFTRNKTWTLQQFAAALFTKLKWDRSTGVTGEHQLRRQSIAPPQDFGLSQRELLDSSARLSESSSAPSDTSDLIATIQAMQKRMQAMEDSNEDLARQLHNERMQRQGKDISYAAQDAHDSTTWHSLWGLEMQEIAKTKVAELTTSDVPSVSALMLQHKQSDELFKPLEFNGAAEEADNFSIARKISYPPSVEEHFKQFPLDSKSRKALEFNFLTATHSLEQSCFLGNEFELRISSLLNIMRSTISDTAVTEQIEREFSLLHQSLKTIHNIIKSQIIWHQSNRRNVHSQILDLFCKGSKLSLLQERVESLRGKKKSGAELFTIKQQKAAIKAATAAEVQEQRLKKLVKKRKGKNWDRSKSETGKNGDSSGKTTDQSSALKRKKARARRQAAKRKKLALAKLNPKKNPQKQPDAQKGKPDPKKKKDKYTKKDK